MVDVVAVIGCVAIVLHDESRLAIFQQKLNALILVLGFSEATELKDSPRLTAISGWVKATMVGCLARGCRGPIPVSVRDVFTCVERFELYSRAGEDRLVGGFFLHLTATLFIGFWR